MKFNWKKPLCAVLSTALLATALAGCGAPSATAQSAGATDNEPVVVKIWVRASSKENNQTITFDEFNASQDKIKVEYEVYGDNYAEVLKLALSSGEAPDSFEVSGLGSIQPYVEAGHLAPLDEFLTDEYRAKFNPSAFTAYRIDGGVYAIPDMSRYVRLFYNKTLFEKAGLDASTPPTSLEEMAQFAAQITTAGAGEYYGFGLPIKSGSTWERNIDNIAILCGLTGPWGFDYTTGQFDFAKQAPVLEYFHELFKSGSLMPGSESLDIEMVRANFATDKIGMYIDGNWMINGYNNELEAAKNLNYDTALIPIFEGEKRAKDYLTLDSGRVITAQSEHKAETFAAIQYALENLYDAPVRKYPDKPLPSLSLINELNDRINSQEEIVNMKGMTGILQDMEQLSAFPVVPKNSLTLEGDNRETIYPLLVIEGTDIKAQLDKLSETYNAALAQAVTEGLLNESDLKPEGFDYFTR